MVQNSIICDSAEDFISKLSLSNPSWWNNNSQCHWIFRGQSSQHQLIPSLFRATSPDNTELNYNRIFNVISPQLLDTVPNIQVEIKMISLFAADQLALPEIAKLIEIIKALFVEISLTENFLIRCNEIRLNTPSLWLFSNQYRGISSVEFFYNWLSRQSPIKNFIKLPFENQLSNGFRKIIYFEYPESMALARHHGVLSRLLDWTKEPMIAAFFSAYNSSTTDDACVLALDKEHLSFRPGHGQIQFYEKLSKSGLEFLHIQEGLFTDPLGIESYYLKFGQWPTLGDYLLKTLTTPQGEPIPQETYLKKILLKASAKVELLKRLDRMGINKYTLMPTYDNVREFIHS